MVEALAISAAYGFPDKFISSAKPHVTVDDMAVMKVFDALAHLAAFQPFS